MITTRPMQVDDLPLGLRLSEQAGWNQTEWDWKRFLRLQPTGCFVAKRNGQGVGTVTTCVFDRVGWIGTLLVREDSRRRGVGSTLLKRAIEYLEAQHVESIRLDATELGQPLYEKMGFVAEYELTRYIRPRDRTDASHDPNCVRLDADTLGRPLPDERGSESHGLSFLPLNEASPQAERRRFEETPVPGGPWEQVVAMDEVATGYSRATLLMKLVQSPQNHAFAIRDTHSIGGFYCARPGRIATQVGPCIAKSPEAGRRLTEHAVSLLREGVIITDIPNENSSAVAIVTSLGLEPNRGFVRMCRGAVVRDRLDQLWASGGPEKG